MYEIQTLSAAQARQSLADLVLLLQDAVDSGASVGFLPPLTASQANRYWERVFAAVDEGSRVLLAARVNGRLIGAVQLDPSPMPNGSHRAEVMKLMVHRDARRRGIGRALMASVEDAARAAGRSLLVLDTRQGDPSEQLYSRVGYTPVGVIPQYARSASGELHSTVFFYKNLTPAVREC